MKRQFDIVLDDSDDEVEVSTRPAKRTESRQEPVASTSAQPAAAPALDASSQPPQSSNWRAQLDAERRARQLARDQVHGRSQETRNNMQLFPLSDDEDDEQPPPPPGSNIPRPAQRFWIPEVERVSNRFHEHDGGFSLRDVMSDEVPSKALVSSFCWSLEWFLPHIDPKTRLMLIMPKPKGREVQAGLRQLDESIRPETFVVMPPMQNDIEWGVMHVKLFALFYEDRCRIVVPTANAESYDWDTIDNMFFVVDLPRYESGENSAQAGDRNPSFNAGFTSPLLRMLSRMGVPRAWTAEFAKYDFSATRDVRLVYSQPGKWNIAPDDETSWNVGGGLPALAQAIRSLRPSKSAKWTVEATGSSYGRITSVWAKQMLAAGSGIHPSTYFTGPVRVPRELRDVEPADMPLKLVFPTTREIDASFLGRPGAGTLFFPDRQWTPSAIHRHFLHQGKSTRLGVIAHTKLYFGIPRRSNQPSIRESETRRGWQYVGSHNFTMAAWGEIVVSKDVTQVRINNWEMGVVMPLEADRDADLEQAISTAASFQRPLERYGTADTPWRQDSRTEGLS